MIPTFIVLLVIALALGGYIIFDILQEKKKTKAIDKPTETIVVDVPPINDEKTEPTIHPKTEMLETDENPNEEVTIPLTKK